MSDRSITLNMPSLHPWQRIVKEHPARFKVLAAGRRWRKTSLGVLMSLEKAAEGKRAWWVSADYPRALIGWRFLRFLVRQIPGASIRESEHIVIIPNGGEVQVKSAKEPDTLRGPGLDRVVIDEAPLVQEHAWSEVLRLALAERKGDALFIGSPKGKGDWFHTLFLRGQGQYEDWISWQRPSFDNPDFTHEEAELIREQEGEIVHLQEVLAQFLDYTTLKPFKAEWITYWGAGAEVMMPPVDLIVEAGFDPAISKRDEACRSALVVAGQVRRGPRQGQVFVLEATAGHWSTYEQAEQILKAVRRHRVRTVRIEDVAYQKALGDVLDREAAISGVALHVELVKPDGDKLRRANAWSPMVESGRVLFGPGQSELVNSMLAVPPAKKSDAQVWDLVDAAGICIRGFKNIRPEQQVIPGQERSTSKLATSYRVGPKPQRGRGTRLGYTPSRMGSALAAGYAVHSSRREPVKGEVTVWQ